MTITELDRLFGIKAAHRHPLVAIARTILLVLAISTAILAVNYAINAALYGLDREPVRAHLRAAFESGALQLDGTRRGDADLGSHQTNDCLIFDMAARDGGNFALYLFAGQRTKEVGTSDPGNCMVLRNWLFADPLVEFREGWYLRYVHSYRAVAIGLLTLFSVETTRAILKVASYASLGLVIALNAFLLWRRQPTRQTLFARNEFFFAAIALAFLLAFGLPYFGQSISHAPAIVTLAALLAAWSFLDARGALSEQRMILLAIPFGVVTTCFEFLCGYVPVGASTLLLLAAITQLPGRDETPRALVRRCALVPAVFVTSVAATLVLHLLFTALATGEGFAAIRGFITMLSFRMSDSAAAAIDKANVDSGTVSLAMVAERFIDSLAQLGLGDASVTLAMLLFALGLLVYGAGETVLSRATGLEKTRAILIAASLAPVVVWIFAFQNHSYAHSQFMVRILVVIPVAAFAMAAFLARRIWDPARTATASPRTLTEGLTS